jgi:hypothetical protein
MRSTRPARPVPALAALAGLALACGSRGPDSTSPAARSEAAPAREDVGLALALVDASRTIDRLTAQYARMTARLAAVDGPALPPAETVGRVMRQEARLALLQQALSLPGDLAVELAAPIVVAALLPRGAEPGIAATVSLVDGTGPAPAFDVGPPRAPFRARGEPLGDGRLAAGYFGSPPADLSALPGLGLGGDDDLVLLLWGVPAAERARRVLFRYAADLRGSGEPFDEVDELLIALASAALDALAEVDELRVVVRLGGPGEPALSVRSELTPSAGTTLAAVFPADARPAGDFPFLAAVPGGARGLTSSRATRGDEALREIVVGLARRLTDLAQRTAPPELSSQVETLGGAMVELLRLVDGRWLDASWPPAGGAEDEEDRPGAPGMLAALPGFGLFGNGALIVGVSDVDAARSIARTACAAGVELGRALAEGLGGPIDIGCEQGAATAAGFEVDVLTLREKVQPGDLEAGRRPFSLDVYFAAGNGRLAGVTGPDWERRIEWALADSAPDGGMAQDPALAELRAWAPEWASTIGVIDIGAPLAAVAGACGSAAADVPAISLRAWAGSDGGRGYSAAESGEDLAERVADVLAALRGCVGP